MIYLLALLVWIGGLIEVSDRRYLVEHGKGSRLRFLCCCREEVGRKYWVSYYNPPFHTVDTHRAAFSLEGVYWDRSFTYECK